MKVSYSSRFPIRGYICVNFFGLLVVRKEYRYKMRPHIYNHEMIHTAQMRELGYVPFYLIYFFEWIYRLIFHTRTAYRGLSFEKEAYSHELELDYLTTRKHFAQWRKRTPIT